MAPTCPFRFVGTCVPLLGGGERHDCSGTENNKSKTLSGVLQDLYPSHGQESRCLVAVDEHSVGTGPQWTSCHAATSQFFCGDRTATPPLPPVQHREKSNPNLRPRACQKKNRTRIGAHAKKNFYTGPWQLANFFFHVYTYGYKIIGLKHTQS